MQLLNTDAEALAEAGRDVASWRHFPRDEALLVRITRRVADVARYLRPHLVRATQFAGKDLLEQRALIRER